MSIAIITPNRNVSILKQTLQKQIPNIDIQEFPNINNPETVEALVLWKQASNLLHQFPNLKFISSLGAGVDHIIFDTSLPKGIPITRIVDEELTISMRKYILMCVLNFQKDFRQIIDFNKNRIWENQHIVEKKLQVGVFGLGALGKDIAIQLNQIGFEVSGFSNSKKQISNIACYSQESGELDLFLKKINVLICLLPLTAETKGILNLELFKKMQANSYLINVGRGQHLVDADLIKAIDIGQIAGAYLDVFNEEPLPRNHPFWEYEEIVITPHIASITNQENAGQQIAENFRRAKNGEKLMNLVNGILGY